MSEVYIRSQNKEGLYRFGGSMHSIEYFRSGEIEYGEKEEHVITISSDETTEKIGKYKTKERCIEVLDELQKVCGQYLYANGSLGYMKGTIAVPPMAATIQRVYEMPQE